MRSHVRRLVLTCTFASSLLTFCSDSSIVFGVTAVPDQLRSSDLSLSTNLWRSEFLAEAAESKDSQNDTDGSGTNASSLAGNHAMHPAGVAAAAEKVSPHVSVVRLEERLFETEATTVETDSTPFAGEVHSGGETVLSDWEKAATSQSGGITAGGTAGGPSMISMVVGVVGIAIVVGAYCSSSSRA